MKKLLFLILICWGYSPAATAQDSLSRYILTPKSGPEPRINGPKIFGVRPDHPILYTIPVTGVRPVRYSGRHLPEGIQINKKRDASPVQFMFPGNILLPFGQKTEKAALHMSLK